MSKVSAIVFHEHGVPASVARCEELEVATPGAGEALVEMVASPINPADLNVLEGKYPVRPSLPGVPGIEGVGCVREVGSEVVEVSVGDLVLLPLGFGAWREAGVTRAAGLVRVPEGVSVEQAAMLRVNPASALRMLHDYVQLGDGDWIAQNAANSAVGRAVIEIGRVRGWRTLSLVRRAEAAGELQALGGDIVLLDDEAAPDALRAATVGAPIRLALNAVGGESALRLANALAPSGTLVTYGAMSRQPVRLPNGLLIFRDLRCRGFWLTRWSDQATGSERAGMFLELFELARQGCFRQPVEARYTLQDCEKALLHAGRAGRSGKILFVSSL